MSFRCKNILFHKTALQKYLFVSFMSFILSFGCIKGLHQFFYAPYFTIIISSYNYGHYLPKTLDSILASTEKSFEIIIVNDGSTDDTDAVIKKYMQKTDKIRVLTQKNQGLSLSRNRAMKYARGKYIWFVDADDFITKDALHDLKEVTQQNTVDIVSFQTQMVDDEVNLLERTNWDDIPYILKRNKNVVVSIKDMGASDILTWPPTSGKQLYRRHFIEKKGIYFPPHTLFEDDVFLVHCIFKGARIIGLEKALYYKRHHERSIVNNKAKYYDSTLRIAFIIYSRIVHTRYSDRFSGVFGGYLAGIWNKWNTLNHLQKMHFYPLLEKSNNWLLKQPDDAFWMNKKYRFSEFFKTAL